MTESFLHLSDNEPRDIYAAGANNLGRAPVVLEKDVWVCWSLAVLFGAADRRPMAFKGGTALSKAHHAIDRFSEDIDVTVQVPSAATLDKDDLPTSSGKRKALATQLNGELREYISDQLLPLFIAQMDSVPGGGRVVQQGESMEELIIAYPTCFGTLSEPPYIAQQVKLELGARNLIDPRSVHRIEPYIASIKLEAPLEFAVAHEVEVLGLERIFWEKATLVHDHCNRKVDETGPAERISRHWYDLAVLTEQGVAARAHERRDQLSSVIRIKNVFYKRATSDYEACLANGLQLVPDAERLAHLQMDYDAMTAANMFVEEPRSFDQIIETLRDVETLLNACGRPDSSQMTAPDPVACRACWPSPTPTIERPSSSGCAIAALIESRSSTESVCRARPLWCRSRTCGTSVSSSSAGCRQNSPAFTPV